MMAFKITDDAGGIRVNLGLKGQRIGLEKDRTFSVADFVFIQLTQFNVGNEQFPHAGFVPCQQVAATVPIVEGSYDTDSGSIGCPQGEIDAGNASFHLRVSTQLGEQGIKRTLLECGAVGLGKKGFLAGVGIAQGHCLTRSIHCHQSVVQLLDPWNADSEQPGGM